MRRTLLTLAFVGICGAFLSSDAGACCHKKKVACTPACAPAPVCEVAPAPAPVCAPAPVAECAPAKKHCGGGFKMPKMHFGCHKKAACAPAAVYAPAPVPVYAPAPACATCS